jgi:hypothetical protein
MPTAADWNGFVLPDMIGVMLTAVDWYGLVLPCIIRCDAHRC